jgi:hypothetical protein
MNIPLVPLAAFSSLIGDVLAEKLGDLLARKDFSEIVLFSDVPGEQLALVAVGPGKRFERLADAIGVEIDGLRALCAFRPRGGETVAGGAGDESTRELAQREESLNARERYIAECEQRIAEVGQNLSEREAMIEQREQQLLAKERDFFRRGGDVARQGGDAGGERP